MTSLDGELRRHTGTRATTWSGGRTRPRARAGPPRAELRKAGLRPVELAVGALVVGALTVSLRADPAGGFPSPLWPAATLVLGIVAIVIFTRFRRGSLVAPFAVIMMMLLSIFAVRPLFMIARHQFDFYGLNVYPGFNQSAKIGFLAVLALALGYASAASRRPRTHPLENRDGRAASAERSLSVFYAGAVVVVLVGLWVVLLAVKGGSFDFVGALFRGRSEAVGRSLAGLPAAVNVFPVAGAFVICAIRIQIERQRRLTLGEHVVFWLSVLATTVPPLALGTRRFLLPCLVAALIAAVAPTARRRVSARIAVAAVFVFLVLAIVPFVRSAGSRRGSQNLLESMISYFRGQGLIGSFEPFFVSYDTEMFNYVAYVAPRLGSTLPYGYGRGTVGDLLLNPLPAGLTPTALWSDKLLTWIFGTGCSDGVCPVPSVVGVLLYDLGLPGVLLGMFAIGWVSRSFEPALATATGWRLVALIGIAAYTPVMARGATLNAAYLLMSSLIISAGVWFVVRRRSTPPALRAGRRKLR